MQDAELYFKVLSGISSGLITLLGSVGIFISIIVQRRVERLQDILEEFMDLSDQEDFNLTGKMFKLIEKYQMHYLMPDTPSKIILTYFNVSLSVIIISWLSMVLIYVGFPFKPRLLPILLPPLAGIGLLLFFRHLIKNIIRPINKPLLSPIIPPPTKLRSVSYLSRYINVSVKAILKQARLSLVLRIDETDKDWATVVLKEELSFDDFFYYLYLEDETQTHFISYGEVRYLFPPDPITGKPVPVEKNVNIPLGRCKISLLPKKDLIGQLLIFPRAEKHPIHLVYKFKQENFVFRPIGEPETKINHLITYSFNKDHLEIIEDNQKTPYLHNLTVDFKLNRKRYYIANPSPDTNNLHSQEFKKEIFVC